MTMFLPIENRFWREAVKKAPSRQPTVLTVDDEPDMRRLIRRALESEGYRVREASSGAEVLALLTDGELVDLLIADVQMPGLQGEELARRVIATRPEQKVLYCTGYADTLFESKRIL